MKLKLIVFFYRVCTNVCICRYVRTQYNLICMYCGSVIKYALIGGLVGHLCTYMLYIFYIHTYLYTYICKYSEPHPYIH